MPFNPLEYPLAWIDPRMMSANNDFVGHIPFVMALVDLLRPKTIVELGTHTGNSYCALCQAVQLRQLPTRCWAVDTWRGDASIGAYDGDAILGELRQYHDPNYAAFSTLLRREFDTALPQFADGSIDLLHIDGCHTYEALRHDFESWLPKMSARGVVIMHDTSEHRTGFGVWKLWSEIAVRYPSFNFEHAHGLGVLLIGSHPEARVQDFVVAANAETHTVREFFAYQGKRVEMLQALHGMLGLAWQTQTTLNRWCANHGRPVNLQVGPLGATAVDPIVFLYNLSVHARQALET